MKRNKTNKIWTVKEVLRWITSYFSNNKIQSALLNAEMIMAKVLNCERIDLYLKYDKPLTFLERKKIKVLIKKRVKNYPLQYLLGETEFYGYKFIINEGVLIPRVETEILIDTIITYIKRSKKFSFNILDLCTGSGIIPITLYKYFSDKDYKLEIIASDISDIALKNAKQNCRLHQINDITIIKSDLFTNISNTFDIITSNPPYIPKNQIKYLPEEVMNFEPLNSIDGGESGLDFYTKIFNECKNYLKEDGLLFFEIGADQKKDIENLCEDYNFRIVDSIKDYNNLWRVVILQ